MNKFLSLPLTAIALLTASPACAIGAASAARAGSSYQASTIVGLWVNQVAANGGTVSVARRALVTTLIGALLADGYFYSMDDGLMLVGENAPQALTSYKRRSLASVGGGTAAFTIDKGYAFSASGWITTAFTPSLHAGVMTGTSVRLASYERTNVGTTSAIGIGASDATPNIAQLNPRGGASVTQAAFNSGSFNSTATVATSIGLTSGYRSGLSWGTRKNGVDLTNASSPSSTATGLVAQPLYIGAKDGNGTAANFRACTMAWADYGGPVTATVEAAAYTAITAFLTAVGA